MASGAWNASRARAIAERERIDGFVAATPANVLYSTGFWSPGGYLGTEPCFAIRSASSEALPDLVIAVGPVDQVVDLNLSGSKVTTYGAFYWQVDSSRPLEPGDEYIRASAALMRPTTGPVDALVEALRVRGLADARLAVDERGFSPIDFDRLKQALPGAALVPAYALFRELRAVKTAEEVELLGVIARITEDAIGQALSIASPGVTELDMSREVGSYMAARDAIPLRIAIGFGDKAAHPNSIATDRRLDAVDVVRFDIGGRLDGYHSDLARTAVIGGGPADIRELYQAMLRGQEAALGTLHPGVAVRHVFQVGMSAVRSSGVPGYERHHIGHGVGLEFYDEPVIDGGSTAVLEEGMVVNIETPCYILGLAGVQVEDTVVVTRNGFRFLTSGKRPLYEV